MCILISNIHFAMNDFLDNNIVVTVVLFKEGSICDRECSRRAVVFRYLLKLKLLGFALKAFIVIKYILCLLLFIGNKLVLNLLIHSNIVAISPQFVDP